MKKDVDQFISITLQIKKFFACPQSGELSMEERTSTTLQFEALRFIKMEKKISMGGLADHLNMSLSSATQLTERLVKSEFVSRVSDDKDRRIIRLQVTKKGEKELIRFSKLINERLKNIFSKVPKKDLKELIRIHKNLLENLQKTNK